MAINFLNNVDYNKNQLLNPRIQNEINDGAAGTPVEGQLYYNTTDNELKYGKDNGTGTIAWSAIDTDTGITSIELASAGNATSGNTITTNGTLTLSFDGLSTEYVNGEGNLVTFPTIPTVPSNIVETVVTINGDYIDLTPTTAASGDVTITADLSAGGTASATTYLRGDNSWEPISAIPGTYTWSIQGDTGGPTAVASGDAIDFAGGTNVTTALSGTTLTINSTDQFVGTLTGIGPGDYISIDNSTPAVPIVNALGTEAATASKLIARDSSGYGYVVTPASGDSTTKIATTAFVQSSLTGLLEFKGGFDASTGAIVGGGNLTSGGTRVAIAVGDYYVVTVAGDFFGNTATPLTPGDSVIVQTAAAAGASVEGDFIVVQSDTDLATLTTVGIGNVNAEPAGNLGGIAVSYNAGTAKVGLGIAALGVDTLTETPTDYFIPIYNSADDENKKVASSDLLNAINSAISYAQTITDSVSGTTFNHGLGDDVIVQLYDTTTKETVYADVERNGNYLNITFATTPTSSVRVLVQKIG